MKKKLGKLMYMGLGALIALGGYFFGTLHNNNVDAQHPSDGVEFDEIRCRKLTVVDCRRQPQRTVNGNWWRGSKFFRRKSAAPSHLRLC